jgi:hypothetical protein
LADVVGVVIGDEQRFAKDSLTAAMRNFREQIGLGIQDELLHCLEVALNDLGALVPSCRAGRRCAFRPVACGPIRRDMFRIPRELEDVPLGEADMLEQFPSGVRGAGRFCASKVQGQAGNCLLEIEVRVFARKQIREMLTERFVVRLGSSG